MRTKSIRYVLIVENMYKRDYSQGAIEVCLQKWRRNGHRNLRTPLHSRTISMANRVVLRYT